MAAAATPGEPPERRDHPVAAGEGRSPDLKAAPERKTHPQARPAVPSRGPVLGSPPGSYSRRVLLAVTGLSPQIVTETLFALARLEDAERFVPTEIRVVTTARGAEHLRLSLLSEEPGWFHRLCRDYGLRDVSFSQEQIYLLRDAAGQALADIRTPEENELAADLITDMVRELTAHEDLALHVSLAGGRKTMGYYAGYALSLYGRPQDRLSHVLVSAPFEAHPQFFYPTPYERVIHSLDQNHAPLDCRDAIVTLANIPFVSLRHGLPAALLAGEANFKQTVAAARQALAPPRLLIDVMTRSVQAGECRFSLPRGELALLALFARRALAGAPPLAAPPKGVPDAQWARDYLHEFRMICDDMSTTDETERALSPGMDGDYFSQKLSKLRGSMKRALGPVAVRYLIDDGGVRPRRYALELPPEVITFASLASEETPE